MRTLLLATPILASVLIASSVTADADQQIGSTSALPAGAPTVQVQPRAEDFSPHSPANEAEQERLSKDEALDKKLNICRC